MTIIPFPRKGQKRQKRAESGIEPETSYNREILKCIFIQTQSKNSSTELLSQAYNNFEREGICDYNYTSLIGCPRKVPF